MQQISIIIASCITAAIVAWALPSGLRAEQPVPAPISPKAYRTRPNQPKVLSASGSRLLFHNSFSWDNSSLLSRGGAASPLGL